MTRVGFGGVHEMHGFLHVGSFVMNWNSSNVFLYPHEQANVSLLSASLALLLEML